eukprot:TRINITY_DN33106_c1_g1_i1.p1 TRINITY_DN33106_c1_g1~~TRINITY_DN33106_c1_g1_i1.p1  ORF type:complete len:131 (-),score=16.38 TRINITY_DN33106_c1_g1_i1:91-483(-)
MVGWRMGSTSNPMEGRACTPSGMDPRCGWGCTHEIQKISLEGAGSSKPIPPHSMYTDNYNALKSSSFLHFKTPKSAKPTFLSTKNPLQSPSKQQNDSVFGFSQSPRTHKTHRLPHYSPLHPPALPLFSYT